MLAKISLVDLLAAVQKKIKDKTGYPCFDHVPKNQESPFYFIELTGSTPRNTKTMWCETYTVYVHVIAAPDESSVGVLQLVTALEEALTEDIALPDGFELVMQTCRGLLNLYSDETSEKHAVEGFDFTVCYGYKVK